MTSGGRKHGNRAAEIAHRYRPQAVAALVAILRDERTPAAARTAAASRLLELSREAEPVKVVDLDRLSSDEREDILNELLEHYGIVPAAFEEGMRQCYQIAKLLHPLGKAEAERLVDLVADHPDALKQLKRLKRTQQQRRRLLPHRQPSSSPLSPASPGPNTPPPRPSDAPDAVHAVPGTGLPPQGTPATPHSTTDTMPKPLRMPGPGECAVNMPSPLRIDAGSFIYPLRAGRQIVPLEIARHRLVRPFITEENDNDAA